MQSHATMASRSHAMRPHFVDPNTNVLYDVNSPEYEGWLTKQSAWMKEWRRRYFILKDSKLFFCKNEYSPCHGIIDLAHCTTVKSAETKAKKKHSFEISTPETTFLLYADTEQEKDDWIGRVGKAIVRCSRTYYPTSGPSINTENGAVIPSHFPNEDDEDDDIYVNEDGCEYFND